MKKCFFLALTAMFAVCTTASAQFSNSGNSGSSASGSFEDWNEFNVQYNSTKLGSDADAISGFSLEYDKAFNLTNSAPVYLQTGIGVQYSFKSEDGYKLNYFWAKVPVNVLYHWDVTGDGKFAIEPLCGLNFRIGISGKQEVGSYDYDIYSDTDGKRFQFGFNVGANFVFNKFVVGASYNGDFTEIVEKAKVSVWNIKLGYRF